MKKIVFSLIMFIILLNGANAATVIGGKISGSTVTGNNTLVEGGEHNGENIENEDCLKYPEKCKADIPNIDYNLNTNDIKVPSLNSAGSSKTNETTQKITKLPRTGPMEIILVLLSILLTTGLFFIFKNKKIS